MSRILPPLTLAVLAALAAPGHGRAQVADAEQVAAAREDRAPGTGHDWIDARLQDMAAYAERYPAAFVDEIVRYHEAPRAMVEAALDDTAFAAGDVYLACALAQGTGRPCREVVDARRAATGEDWNAIATRLGIAADSEAWGRIRRDIVASYARWARPIDPHAAASPRSR